jgi:hypothetical protein
MIKGAQRRPMGFVERNVRTCMSKKLEETFSWMRK